MHIPRASTDYRQPELREMVDVMMEGGEVAMSISARPARDFLAEGGRWVWAFSLAGDRVATGDATIRFNGGDHIEWRSSPEVSMLAGYGPRFEQGPSTSMTSANLEFSITIHKSGTYTLRAWIMEERAAVAGDLPSPSSTFARCPELAVPLTVKKLLPPRVEVKQTLSGPRGVQQLDQYIGLLIADRVDRGDTEWTGTVEDYIAIEKEGINASDVAGRVGSFYNTIVWEEEEGRLIGHIKSTVPYGLIPQTRWTINVELSFFTGGSYNITTWAEDGDNGKIVSEETRLNLIVEARAPIPDPLPDPNSTNNTSILSRPFTETGGDLVIDPYLTNVATREQY